MLSELKEVAREWLQPAIPARLRRRHISVPAERLEEFRASLAHQPDWHQHLLARTQNDRRVIVPWLDAACRLDGLRILEVGCGTGCSTVALAEQGALVTGIDVDTGGLRVAHERCRLYGVRANLHELNAVEAARHFKTGDFDLIIFFACLEHMTAAERMDALPALWDLLPVGAWLAIVETPNRLWYFDFHTSKLPFFNWLPDEVAFAYSKFSDRELLKDDTRRNHPAHLQEFLRLGRGVSYHEFDLTIGTRHVCSSFSTFYGSRYTLLRSMRARRFKSLLKSLRRDLHDGWFEPSLDLLMKKT